MTPAELEPAIPGPVGPCLIHWATGPSDFAAIRLHTRAFATTTTATKRRLAGASERPFAARVPLQPCGWPLPVVGAVLSSATTAEQCVRAFAPL